MAKFNWKPAKDAEGNVIDGAVEAAFQAKLLGFIKNADGTVKTYESQSTDALYHTANIEFDGANGKETTMARVYAGNYDHGMNVGESYATTVRVSRDYPQPFVQMSHLKSAGVATRDAFGLEGVEIPQAVVELEDADDERLS